MKFHIERKYLYGGLTAFIVIVCSVLFSFIIYNFKTFNLGFDKFWKILQPIINGFLIAYVLCPVMDFYSKKVLVPLFKKFKKNLSETDPKVKKLSILLTLVTAILVIYFFIQMIVPQLAQSIKNIIISFPDYLNQLEALVQTVFKDYPEIESLLNDNYDSLEKFANSSIMPSLSKAASGIYSGISTSLSFIWNLVLGLIISVYILSMRERFLGQVKKIIFALWSRKCAKDIINEFRFINVTFLNYIMSSIIDSLIIGILCFITCSIAGIPYVLLVSVIVGITNIIPFFGPFLGAIPAAFIILLTSPIKTLFFIIIILILQQCDGNIIKPKLFGNSTGLNGFWVLFSILVGGGFFGAIGMYLGVPVFAVIYYDIKRRINIRLSKKGLTTDTDAYINNENNIEVNENV